MKHEFVSLTFLAFLFLAPFASASSVTRTLPGSAYSGETISVTIDVAVTGGETYYLIDEIVPPGWVVTNAGAEGSSEDPGHVKWAVIQNAQDAQYTYEIQAPYSEGSYSFSGKYMLEGMKSESPIGGQSSILVRSSAAYKPGFENWIAPIVIIAALAVATAIWMAKKPRPGLKSRPRKHA